MRQPGTVALTPTGYARSRDREPVMTRMKLSLAWNNTPWTAC